MLALQLQSTSLMGLADDGQPVAPPPLTADALLQQIRDRVVTIRQRLVTFGIPAAVITGGATTLVFAGAFELARTQRVWVPAAIIGGAVTLAGLLGLAAASSATAPAPNAITVTPVAAPAPAPAAAPAPTIAPAPAAF